MPLASFSAAACSPPSDPSLAPDRHRHPLPRRLSHVPRTTRHLARIRPIEWPNAIPSNPYQQAFLWIRANTPPNAVFAFNPQLVYRPGEDEQGFRALAERDHLADDKDAGIVAVVPSLADRWANQRHAESAIETMTDAQRQATLTPLGVTWLVLAPETPTNLTCPWRNQSVKICRMN